ncbi:MAG: 30S ribosomal protein S4 [Candidatus Parcubacteria bacterium]|nr:MAG: 30S ribosomal protein S4 [Candidatus Parcubacteria bacterium]
MKIEAKCKICRKLGQKLLWNERCMSGKCSLSRRRIKPGIHGYKPRSLSDFAKQLIEKQKLKNYYLLKEKQLKNFIDKAKKNKEPLPLSLIKILESKFDNFVWRSGYSLSKLQSRQLITHGHFLINDKKINLPNYLLKPGDIIKIREESKKLSIFRDIDKKLKNSQIPSWIKFNFNDLSAEFIRYPELEEINLPFNLSIALQFYGK